MYVAAISTFQCVVFDAHEVVNHYYCYLESHIDADSVSHMMHCKHLITDDDYAAITSAPNDIKMNTVMLQYVKNMNVDMFMSFCEILKDLETQKRIGESLSTCT